MQKALPRRRALSLLASTLLGLWSGGLALLAGLFTTTPIWARRRGDEVLLGDLTIYGAEFREIRLRVPTQDGWRRTFRQHTFYIHADEEGMPEVFSARCSHLGCTVGWDAQAQEFRCPCHGGRFSSDGSVLGGPPPAPLTRIASALRGGDIFIKLPA